MKSAYELAMERLQKGAPTVTLTDDQKRQIAEINFFSRKDRERELFLRDQIRKAQASGKVGMRQRNWRSVFGLAGLAKNLICEEKKEKLRGTFKS